MIDQHKDHSGRYLLETSLNAGTHFLCLLTHHHHHQINHYWYTLNGRLHISTWPETHPPNGTEPERLLSVPTCIYILRDEHLHPTRERNRVVVQYFLT